MYLYVIYSSDADILLFPKNRHDRVFNIPLKSVKSALVSQKKKFLKSESPKCLQNYLA